MRPLLIMVCAILIAGGILATIGTLNVDEHEDVSSDTVSAAYSAFVSYDADTVTLRLTPSASTATVHIWTVTVTGVPVTRTTYDAAPVDFELGYSTEPATITHAASDGSSSSTASSEVSIDGAETVVLQWSEGTVSLNLNWQTYSGYRYRENAMPDLSSMLEAHDAALDGVVSYLTAFCAGMTDDEKTKAVLNFVQDSISYETDEQSRGAEEWYKYPYETLFDGTGDCEDTSILFVTIARSLGLDAVLVSMDGHMAAAVTMTECTGTSYEFDGKTYWYCETSVDTTDLAIGEDVLGRAFVAIIS